MPCSLNGEPDAFQPPNGWWTSQPLVGRFTATCPTWASRMKRCAAARSWVNTEAASPYAESLAAATAASNESTTKRATTGPNTSSRQISMELETSRIVGDTKQGPCEEAWSSS